MDFMPRSVTAGTVVPLSTLRPCLPVPNLRRLKGTCEPMCREEITWAFSVDRVSGPAEVKNH
jgi:hypothetical protein